MSRKQALWLAAVPFVVLAAIGHWTFWYEARLRPATPGDDLPSKVLRSDRFDSAVWLAHPHQNLPALADMTGLDAAGLEAALRLAGVDGPRLRGVRIPPASSLAVGRAAEATGAGGERWIAVAEVHPLAAGFLRLAGALAGNPWLGGGKVPWTSGDVPLDVIIAWHGTTWTASTDPADVAALDTVATTGTSTGAATEAGGAWGSTVAWGSAVAWIRHRPAEDPDPAGDEIRLPSLTVYLLAEAGEVKLASRIPSLAATDKTPEGSQRLRQGRRVLDTAEALLVLLQRARHDDPDQSMLLLPLPAGTHESELPRSAVLHRQTSSDAPNAPHHECCAGEGWELPGETLLDAAGHDLPRGRAAGWTVRGTDAVALGSALAAAPELRALAEDGKPPRLPEWGLWLDVVPASVEIERLARGLEKSPFLRRDHRRRWQDAAELLRALARRPARIEGYLDGDDLLLRWSSSPGPSVATSPSG